MRGRNRFWLLVILLCLLIAIMMINIWKMIYKDDDVYRVTGEYTNAYIIGNDKSRIQVLADGERRYFKVRHLEQKLAGGIADLQVLDGCVTKISLKKDTFHGKVTRITSDAIEVEGYGTISLKEDFKAYRKIRDIDTAEKEDLILGYDIASFYLEQDKICAAVITKTVHPVKIRVLLNNTDYLGKYHDAVTVSSDAGFVVKAEDGKLLEKKDPGELFSLKQNIMEEQEKLVIESTDSNKPLKVLSINRAEGSPEYLGTLEVTKEADGYLLVNEVDLESYLKGVVVSEMPSSFPKKALEVQAICARTYAYRQIMANALKEYGAHLDDSTSSQVYNNISHTKEADDAVDATNGKVITSHDQPIEAFFFSTSCGVMTDETIWGKDNIPYLTGKWMGKEENLNLQKNEDFDTFIKKKYDCYDSSYPLFRWSFSISKQEIEKRANQILEKEIGDIKNISIVKRGVLGIALELLVEGEKAEASISGELKIREFLAPVQIPVTLADGTTREDQKLMSSAYITIEKGERDTYHIYGGGYGHGVGMSQNAVKTMADEKMSVKEMIEFFYDDVAITQLYHNTN